MCFHSVCRKYQAQQWATHSVCKAGRYYYLAALVCIRCRPHLVSFASFITLSRYLRVLLADVIRIVLAVANRIVFAIANRIVLAVANRIVLAVASRILSVVFSAR